MLDHQNIVEALDIRVINDGRLFFSMEWMQGISIAKYCDKNKLTFHDRFDLFVQVYRTIYSTYHTEVMHHVFKPSNVLATFSMTGIASLKLSTLAWPKRCNRRLA